MQHIRGINGTVLSKYRLSTSTGLTTAMVAGGCIFSARWAPANGTRCMIAMLRLRSQLVVPFTASQEYNLSAFIARSFTASDSNGTVLLPSALNNLMSSVSDSANVPVTNFTDMRVATTGVLGSGTRTNDAQPILQLPSVQIAAAPTALSYNETTYEPSSDQRYGINLQQNEGITINNTILQGAGGTVRYFIEMEWYEYQGTGGAETIA